ncbi:MAG: mechanosensitive ion channel [Ignavibacteriales bacterium]|nr:mechanosensitive ion channel [Ignavibacteriales bacterium]
MEWIDRVLQTVKEILAIPIFKIGDFELTVWTILYLFIFSALLLYLSSKVKRWTSEIILKRTSMDIGRREAMGSITSYVVLIVGFLVIIQTAGIDLTTLNVLAGAVGIGVGFGLQNIANNFISGIIILLEQPVKVGDRIVVGDVEGDITHIGARSTRVLTNDNITILIPNAQLISENVVNWSHNDNRIRFRIPVSVAYGTDARLVEQVLLEVASANSDVLKQPAPSVRFKEFGDNGMLFELLAWTDTLTHRRGYLVSTLNFAINDTFRLHKIEIPFPQRDVRIKEGKG